MLFLLTLAKGIGLEQCTIGLHAFFFSPTRAKFPTHLIFLHSITQMVDCV